MTRAILLLLIYVSVLSCGKDEGETTTTTSNKLDDVTSLSSYEARIKEGVSLMFVHATWCSKCAAQRPAVEGQLENKTFSGVKFGQVDYEKVTAVVTKYDVIGFPTIIIYKNNVEKHRLLGQGHSQAKIADLINGLL